MSNPFEDLRQAVVVRPISSSIVVIRPSNSPGPQGPSGPELKIQYSANLLSWHDVPAENDMYVRFSTNNGRSWGEPLLISNLAGSVIGPESSVDGNIAVFDGATGKVIKDAGFEPIKGPEYSTSGNVAIYDGTTGKVLKDGGITSNVWDVIIEDRKSQGTLGGKFESGAWRTRNLNTLVFNHNSLASLSNNRFTLPAGTYCIDWDAPAHNVNNHKSALYNYTGSTIVAYGTSARSDIISSTATSSTTSSVGTTVITVTSSTTFEIRHICKTTRDSVGFGIATNLATEIYTRVRIKKIA